MMKSRLFRLFALVAALSCVVGANAYDFAAGGVYYNITSNNTVEVTNQGYNNSYSGDLTIPSRVTNGGKTYTVTRIGNFAFSSCSSLTSLNLPTTITAIDTMAIYYCTALTSITIPEGVQRIAQMNFYNMTELTTVVLPSSLQFVGYYCFISCPKLSSITCNATTPPTADYTSFNDLANVCVLYVPESAAGAYAVAEGWKKFTYINYDPNAPEAYAVFTEADGKLTFYYDKLRDSRPGISYSLNTSNNAPGWWQSNAGNVTQVVFTPQFADARPKSTYSWFSNMQNLQSIVGLSYLNTSWVTYMNYMFFYCNQLTSLDLSNFDTSNVTEMNGMFMSCNRLREITLGRGFTKLGEDAFTSCYLLDDIYCLATTPPTLASNTFLSHHYSNTTLWVPAGSVNAYKAAEYWKNFTHIQPINSSAPFGDVNGDNTVDIIDVTTLIDYVLTGDGTGINVEAADCSGNGEVDINDVTMLIDYVLSGQW